MPFELGLAVALAQAENGRQNAHQFRMLEAEPYRLHVSLSDVMGHDPFIHGGHPHGVLEALTNVFAGLPAPTDASMRLIFRKLTEFRRQNLGTTVFQPKPFSQLKVAARELVTRL